MRYFFVLGLFAWMGISGCNGPNMAESEKDVRQYLILLKELHETLKSIEDEDAIPLAAEKINKIGSQLHELKSKQTRICLAVIEKYDPHRRKWRDDIQLQRDRLLKMKDASSIVGQVDQLFDELSGPDKQE
jgi:hypothetical protein